eukprot:COSAG04_NODE_1695_length_5903_cov_8.707099_7_plen_247_part_00
MDHRGRAATARPLLLIVLLIAGGGAEEDAPSLPTSRHPRAFVGTYHAATGNVADGHNSTADSVGSWGIVAQTNVRLPCPTPPAPNPLAMQGQPPHVRRSPPTAGWISRTTSTSTASRPTSTPCTACSSRTLKAASFPTPTTPTSGSRCPRRLSMVLQSPVGLRLASAEVVGAGAARDPRGAGLLLLLYLLGLCPSLAGLRIAAGRGSARRTPLGTEVRGHVRSHRQNRWSCVCVCVWSPVYRYTAL